MYDEAVIDLSFARAAGMPDNDWSITAEELPCLLDMRVTRTAGRRLAPLPGVIALGPAV